MPERDSLFFSLTEEVPLKQPCALASGVKTSETPVFHYANIFWRAISQNVAYNLVYKVARAFLKIRFRCRDMAPSIFPKFQKSLHIEQFDFFFCLTTFKLQHSCLGQFFMLKTIMSFIFTFGPLFPPNFRYRVVEKNLVSKNLL